MTTRFIRSATAIAIASASALAPAAMAADSVDTQKILQEIQALKKGYEGRIAKLEAKLKALEQKRLRQTASAPAPATSGRSISDNSFNPSIGVILNGKAASFSRDSSGFSGFGVGEEGERGREGLAIDESELNFSANIDDKFYGSTTVAIVREDGSDKIELEEAYIQTLPGAGLPSGTRVKAGRAFWTLGYLNDHHTHTDDFVDRPLPYRVYLNNAFNDDGVEFSYVLPTDLYSEIGGGVFRGDDFPAGGSSSGLGGWSAFARIGGDLGDNHSWRLGGYLLHSDVNSRTSNENTVTFVGKSDLYAADLRYVWTPTGNPKQSEVILQAEYFHRLEDGTYNDTTAGTGAVAFDEGSSGWYAQSVYKFAPNWRVGARYARMQAPDIPAGLVGSAIDGAGHDPSNISIMGDWTNSEFGRLRLQYSREELSSGSKDNQFYLQYIMSLGAHGAHAF
jgi:hypothetical protein